MAEKIQAKPVEVIEEKTQAEELEEAEKKAEELSTEKSDKKPEKERAGILYIYTSKNNTILALTDMAGNTLSRSSGGQSTKQSRLKSSPTVAMFATKKIEEDAKEYGINALYVRIKARTGEEKPGSASHAVVKALGRDDFKIISIMDTTKNPRGGSKKPNGRRGRRV